MTTSLKGAHVRITGTLPNDPNPLAIGEEGIVTSHRNIDSEFEQLSVKWNSGRTLMLLPDDPFEVIA